MSFTENSPRFINCKGSLLSLDHPRVMGILNLTPDSFFDGGKHKSLEKAINKTKQMVDEGASFIDVGAYSSRPGAEHISQEEELKRLFFLKELIIEFPNTYFSIDTFRAEVAKFAIENGASIVNDISGGEADDRMYNTVAELQVPYICMHMKGSPQNMQKHPEYENIINELAFYFSEKMQKLNLLGVNDVILDPGFGFGKTVEHNFEILRRINEIMIFDTPFLIGVSRKSMINKTLNVPSTEALNGTTALNSLALLNGASILRVHDVKEAIETIKLVQAYRGN